MKKKTQSDRNYLDNVPRHNPELKFEIDENNRVIIYQENKGLMKTLTQKLMKKPRISMIHLDELGSFVWQQMDGERTVYEIAERVKEHFGENADPLYNRLVTYVDTLRSYQFIHIN